MDFNKEFDLITKKYYAPILRYCKIRLQNDRFAAEECTQDVFLLLYKKIRFLNLDDNIQGWLYAAADRIVRNYIKKNRKRLETESVPLDSIIEMPDETPEDYSDYFQSLTTSEYSLLREYYSSGHDERSIIAQRLGLSMDALYQRICTIKRKLKRDK